MRKEMYDMILKEYFDLSHTQTRKVMLAIDEADQNKILESLSGKLYEKIIAKVDDIDYDSIPASKGNIEKIDGYQQLEDSVQVMNDLLIEFKQKTESIDIIVTAIENVKKRTELFEKGFRYNIELPMVTYCTICLSIISSISFLISTCVEFIKTPSQDDFDLVLDKMGLNRTKQNLVFRNLEKFNKACSKGQIDSSLDYIIKNNPNVKQLLGVETSVIVGSIALAGIIFNIIPILRELLFFFYYSRTRVSDYLDIQADLLQMNAYNIENNNSLDPKKRKEIQEKQLKIVERFRKTSQKIAVTMKTSEVKADKEIVSDNKKYKTDELVDTMPDSASSSLF